LAFYESIFLQSSNITNNIHYDLTSNNQNEENKPINDEPHDHSNSDILDVCDPDIFK
jgi:hypothetical protein